MHNCVAEVLQDGTKGTVHDKARLLALTAIVLSGDTKSDYEAYESAFSTGFIVVIFTWLFAGCLTMALICAGCAAILTAKAASTGDGGDTPAAPLDPEHEAMVARCIKAVSFIRRLQSLQAPLSRRFKGAGGSSGGLSSLLTSAQSRGSNELWLYSVFGLFMFSCRIFFIIASSLVAKATSFFAKFSPMHVTRVAEALAEGRSCPENDSYCTLDPRKLGPPSSSGGASEQQPRYSDVIVFVIGGGCYSEYFNLMEIVKQNLQTAGGLKHIYYGSTELLSGPEFMSQLERSGSA